MTTVTRGDDATARREGGAGGRAEDHADGPNGPDGARETVRMTTWVRGRVQRVGFRWFTREAALRIGGLAGFAVNLDDGRVHVVAEGAPGRCEELLAWLRTGDTPGRVAGVTEIWGAPRGGYDGFEIR